MNKLLPKFSVVIPTYNRAKLLKECLDSLIAQSYTGWEAIIVDNYSEDDTEHVVNSYNDERFIYVKNHNFGIISISRNKALDIARGEWICFLDSDDCWLPNKLETILLYTSSYDLIYHGYRKYRQKERKRFFQRTDCFFYDVKEPTVSYVLQRGDPFNPSCTCVSKKIVGNTRFSEDKSLIAVEDYDFFLQLLQKNLKIKYLRKVLTLYDVSGCSHDGKSSQRDKLISQKWKNCLDENQRIELVHQENLRKANDMWSLGNYEEAIVLLKSVLRSSISSKRIQALRNLTYCYINIFFNYFK